MLCRELSDLLGCRVHRDPLVRTTVTQARRVEGGAESVGGRRTHPRADARLGAKRGKA